MSNLLSNPILIIVVVGIISILTFLYFFTRKSDQQTEKLDKFDELYKKISEEIKTRDFVYQFRCKFILLTADKK